MEAESIGAQAVVELVRIMLGKMPGTAQSVYKKLQTRLNKGFSEYLEANNRKCQKIKTLLDRDRPVNIEDVFVEPSFRIGNDKLSTEEILVNIENKLERTVITGLAGSGKSIFLRYAFRKIITEKSKYYPIFFELRDISRYAEGKLNLEKCIFESIARICEEFKITQFKRGLRQGKFYVLLDGLDEVAISYRDDLEEEIREFARKYTKCPIIVSSRPNDGFIAWSEFSEAHLMPFSKDQSLEFIDKTNFNSTRKGKFMERLADNLYEKNKDFLSNPLLASMMLLTYDEYGDIPHKRHVFYDKCFQVLLREHDISKESYLREFHTGLDYQEIENLFMYFCTYSYLESAFKFNTETIKRYAGEAIESVSVEANVSKLVRDFVESLSIIQKDGDYFEFSHRSFQEYFYAKFVVKDREYSLKEKLFEARSFGVFDDVVEMVSGMDNEYFCNDFLLPEASRLLKELQKVDTSRRPSSVLKKFFNDVGIGIAHREGNRRITYYSNSSSKNLENRILNMIILQQARSRKSYRNLKRESDYGIATEEKKALFGNRRTIPIHHMNDEILLKLESNLYADDIRRTLEMLVDELNDAKISQASNLLNKMRLRKLQ